MENIDSLKSIPARMMGDTPPFWKKVRTGAIWLVGIAGAVIGTAALAPVTIPAIVVTVCQYIVFGGTVLGLSAQATTTQK